MDRPFVGLVLAQLFRDAPIPIAIYDAEGTLVQSNDAHDAFVMAFGDRLGARGINVLTEPGVEAARHRAHFLRALEGVNVDYALELDAGDGAGAGHRQEFQYILTPTVGEDGRVAAVTSMIVDVTEWLGAERDRTRLQAQLLEAKKAESLGLLVGGIAHDFNNLLVSVLGNASLLLDRLGPDPDLRPLAEAIELSAERAADVARQLLAYAGKGRFRTETIELADVVRETADVLRITIAGKGELELDLAPDGPAVEVDVTQIRQVVMNLITNARDALDEGGRITIRTRRVSADDDRIQECLGAPDPTALEFALVEVEDTGCGIEPDAVPLIFDPLYTTKATGHGLGLSAVLGIVSNHGGGLRVSSRPGEGTSVGVLLPVPLLVRRSVASDRPGPVAPARASSTGYLLVVDDEEAVRTVLQLMLEELGWAVRSVDSGAEALDVLDEDRDRVSAVLLDLRMPGEDGAEIFALIRKAHPGTPVIFMSGYHADSLPQAEAFLHKPFTLEKLRNILGQVLTAAEEP